MKRKNITKNINRKRSWRRIRSKLKKQILRGGAPEKRKLIKYNLYDWYRKNKKPLFEKTFGSSSNKKIPPKTFKIILPTNFSFIEDHDKTFDFLSEIDKLIENKVPYKLNFSHTSTRNIDLVASHLFDRKINEYKSKWSKKGYLIPCSGEISDSNRQVNNFLLSFGLLNSLGIDPHQFSPLFIDYDYEDKYVTHKFSGTSEFDYLSGQAATRLADYFNKCLSHNNYQLSGPTYRKLIGAISEIICNAEEHSSQDITSWDTLGCYNKTTHECSFAIINNGATIYESLKNSKYTTPDVITDIGKVYNANLSLFEKQKQKLVKISEEPFWNMMALQDGISSKRPDTSTGKRSTRGQGLMDFLEFINSIGEKNGKTKVSIISGGAKLLIDFSYPIRYVKIDTSKETRRKIIFNKDGNIFGKQDVSKVIQLKHHFQGTIISGKFIISEDYLDTLNEGHP